MKKKLQDLLNVCSIKNGIPADWTGWDDFSREVTKHKGQWLETGDVYTILFDKIMSAHVGDENNVKPSGKLKDILKTDELAKLVDEIVEFIESIPRKYTVHLVVNKESPFVIGNLKFADGVLVRELITGDSLLSVKLDEHSPSYSILFRDSMVFKEGETVFSFSVEGFAKSSIKESAVSVVLSRLKHFLYFGQVLKILKHEAVHFWSGQRMSTDMYVQDEALHSNTVMQIEQPPLLSKYLAGIKINSMIKEGKLTSKLKDLLNKSTDDKSVSPLRTAAEWAFDSNIGDNETISFIQLSIALEAILGDDEQSEGLTNKLADRCAYLIGRDSATRKELKEAFKQLYTHRSKLVHGRRVKISPEGSMSFMWGKSLLSVILRQELINIV